MSDDGITRRQLLRGGAAFAGSAALLGIARKATAQESEAARAAAAGKPAANATSGPLHVPNGELLPWRMVDGVRVFHLVAQPIVHTFAPGLDAVCWGYNGRTPGPVIEAIEGEPVRIYVTNALPEATTVHWHGVLPPNGMDGVGGLTQPPIPAGSTFVYEFAFDRAGSFMYHPHFDEMLQIAMGLAGMIVVHPRGRREPVDRDYPIMLQEWLMRPGTARPDPTADTSFNVLTMNGKAFPATEALVAATGERVRIRLGNLSPMEHHPIHLHGHVMTVVATDGGPIPRAGRWPETTVLVPVGSTRTAEFDAGAPGDWALHCHMTHHMMNQMGHDLPNLLGIDATGLDERISKLVPGFMVMGEDGMAEMGRMEMPVPPNSIPMKGLEGPFGYIDMGGMFSIFKVRESVQGFGDPGWYDHPAGEVARAASAAELARDGIDVRVDPAPAVPHRAQQPATQPGTQPATQPGTQPATRPKTAPETQPGGSGGDHQH